MNDAGAPPFHVILTHSPTAHRTLRVTYTKGRLPALPRGALPSIREIAEDHPDWGPERIAKELGELERGMVLAIGAKVLVHMIELVTGRPPARDD